MSVDVFWQRVSLNNDKKTNNILILKYCLPNGDDVY